MPERLPPVQQQQKLLVGRGFSKSSSSGAVPVSSSTSQQRGGRSVAFAERQDQHLARTGRTNAAGASRRRVELTDDGNGEAADDGASVFSRSSLAPSLHPSVAGTMASEACHSETVGAGDETLYWDYQHRAVQRQDLGHRCRECRMSFSKIGEPLTERRGARVSMRYHAACFSGFADPRSQASSSHHTGRLSGTQFQAAPATKTGKMRTSQHFDGGGAQRSQHGAVAAGLGAGSGKSGTGLCIGSNGFGAKSSRGTGLAGDTSPRELDLTLPRPSVGLGISEAALRAHQESLSGTDER